MNQTKIKHIMTGEVPIVSEKDPIARVRNIFTKKGVSKILVYEEEQRGIITEGDVAREFAEERRGIDEVRVREIMTRSIIKTGEDEEPEEAARTIVEKNISSLPVIEQDKVKGILTKENLTKYFIQQYKGKEKVKDLMTEDVKTIRENQSIFHSAKEMEENNISRLVVTRDKKPIGIITERDLSLATRGVEPSSITYESGDEEGRPHYHKYIYPMIISDVMQTDLKTIEPKAGASKAAKKMLNEDIGSLVVEENGELKGIITKTDFTKYLAQKEKD